MPNTDTFMVLTSKEDFISFEVQSVSMKSRIPECQTHVGFFSEYKRILNPANFIDFCQEYLDDFIEIRKGKSGKMTVEIPDLKEQEKFTSNLKACEYIRDKMHREEAGIKINIIYKGDIIRTDSDGKFFLKNKAYDIAEKRVSDLGDSE